MAHTGTNSMTKDKLIETLKLAQDALHMATLPFTGPGGGSEVPAVSSTYRC